MNSIHPPDTLLARFASGDFSGDDPDTSLAIEIATHVDDCPACAARVVSLDPLSAAFASVDDPVVPDDLVAEVHAAVQRRDLPGPEPAIAAGLLGLAAALLLVAGAPGQVLTRGAAALSAVFTAADTVFAGLGAPVAVWTVLAAAMLAASVLTVRRLEVQRHAGRAA